MQLLVGVVGVGAGAVLLWMSWQKRALTQQEGELLLCGVAMSWLAPWGWPISYYFYLCLVGRQALVLYNMAKSTLYFARQGAKANPFLRFCFECDEREIILGFWAVAVYLWVRITTIRSWDYPVDPQDPSKTFMSEWNGWNCTMAQFWFINCIWWVVLLLACLAAYYLITHDSNTNPLYKQYLLQYKLIPSLIIATIVTWYNLSAHQGAHSLPQCGSYYHSGQVVRFIWFLGQPITTIGFFIRKHGEFKFKSASSDADIDQEQGLEQRLNHEEIDRQFERVSHHHPIQNQKSH